MDTNTNINKSKYTLFWHEYDENGCFSNWYDSPFVIDDFCYFHVEQYIMSQKAKLFHDSVRYTAILRAIDPGDCKRLGKLVTPFDQSIWDDAKYNILLDGIRAKFNQNEDLAGCLRATGDRIIAEASPYDGVFGIKIDAATALKLTPDQWPGQNLLGKALMQIRSELNQ